MSTGGTVSEKSVRVLYVDTGSDVPVNFAERLENPQQNLTVVIETDPADALDRFETTTFDCIVSEYDLPEMTGIELLDAVRARDDTIPFVLFTGNGDEEIASRAISAGVTDYVRKSEGIDSLAERINDIVGGQSLSETKRGYDSAQFEQFLDALPDAVFVVDEDGRYLDFITGGEQSLLYDDIDELLGRRFHDIFPEGVADQALDVVNRAFESGEQQIEYQLDVQRGKRWFEARVGPLQTDAEPRTAFWIARDITKRKRREQEYEQIFNGVPNPVTVNDPETGELLEVNDAMCETLGYEKETILEKGIDRLTIEEEGFTSDRATEIINRVMESGERETFEWKLEAADGNHRILEVTGTPVEINGEDRYVSLTRDITERKQRELEYEQIFDNVNDAITVFDPETGKIVDVNETYHEMLGYDDLETIRELGIGGLSASEEGYTGERGKELIREVSETGEPKTVDWRGETSEGDQLWLEATLAPAEIGGRERVLSIQRDITERRELEQTYQDIFENVSDGLVIHDPATGDILEVNQQYCELTGYDREELLESTIRPIMPDDPEYTYEDVLDRIKKAREEGPQLFEFKGKRKDGDVFISEVNLRTIEIRGDERVLASVRDITERKRRKREYERIFHGVNDVITIHDHETAELLEVNDTFCDLLGYDREEILEMGIAGYSPTDKGYTIDQAKSFVEEVIEKDEPQQTEWAVQTRDGETRWLDVKGTTVEIGGDVRYVSISRDVTERRRREREYEQIFNNVNDIIAVRDPETGKLLDVNQSYADLLGYDREEMQGMDISDVGLPDEGYDNERGMEHLRTVMESDEPVEFEWKVEDAEGQPHLMDVRGTKATINGEQRYLAIGRDITERKRRERAINTLQGATERLQTATTPAEVATIAVDTASDVLDLPMAICWLHDEERRRLEPAAATDDVHEAGLVSGLSPDRYEYDVFQDGTVTEYTPREEGPDNPLETGVLLPLADHGLLAAATRRGGPADETVLDVAKALADHVTTALERVERAQAVRESERRFRMIAERIDEVIYLAEADLSEVLYVNPAYEKVWGRAIDKLDDDARAFIEAVDHRDRDRFETKFETMVEEIQAGNPDDSYDFEYRIRQPDGEIRWVNGTGYAVELPGEKRRFVGIVEDITERKRREQRLEVFNRILRHNLRNQLDVIRSHAEVLSDRTTDDHAERIMASVDELASIGAEARETDRIMSMGKKFTEIRISETIRGVLESVDLDRQDVTLRTELQQTRPLVTNEEAVEIAVASALENAIEHADSTVAVTVADEAEGSVVSIEDDGPGIPEEQLVPIKTGTETSLRHGRGLGLWQLRWSVDKLNGELSFETTGGTTVQIEIPDQRDSS